MITFIREKLIFIIATILMVLFILPIFFIEYREKEKSTEEYPCAEYQDSIYLLNYKISQLEIKVGSLLLKLEEIEEANPGILKEMEEKDFQ